VVKEVDGLLPLPPLRCRWDGFEATLRQDEQGRHVRRDTFLNNLAAISMHGNLVADWDTLQEATMNC